MTWSSRKPTNYYDKTRRGLGYITPPTPLPSEEDKIFPSYSSTSSEWESDVSMGVLFEDLFINIIDQLEHEEAIEIFDAEP